MLDGFALGFANLRKARKRNRRGIALAAVSPERRAQIHAEVQAETAATNKAFDKAWALKERETAKYQRLARAANKAALLLERTFPNDRHYQQRKQRAEESEAAARAQSERVTAAWEPFERKGGPRYDEYAR